MRTLKIGTRKSPLALWQANLVAEKLNKLGYLTELVPVVSHGDKNVEQPLYKLGITGVFTKDLDIALLNGEVNIAVHSLKDVPTILPEKIQISAVLKRDFSQDVLIRNSKAQDKAISELSIATSSLRRRAFWLNQYPDTIFQDIRGNVQTRLQKLEEGLADATLLSLAGIKRLNLSIDYEEIPFMLQAPSQGVICCTSLSGNNEILDILQKINHTETQKCIDVERSFLNYLEGGCTAPIGAYATLNNDLLSFEGKVSMLDGSENIIISEKVKWNVNLGSFFAKNILERGGKTIMEDIKSSFS